MEFQFAENFCSTFFSLIILPFCFGNDCNFLWKSSLKASTEVLHTSICHSALVQFLAGKVLLDRAVYKVSLCCLLSTYTPTMMAQQLRLHTCGETKYHEIRASPRE